MTKNARYSGKQNETSDDEMSNQSKGEQSVSGHLPDPESDDNSLQNAHAVGLQPDEDEEHPKPLDIASSVDAAEKYHRQH